MVAVPETRTETKKKRKRQPRYHVILWDSDDHTYQYVEKMLCDLFGHEEMKCHELAVEVDKQGRAIVLTTTMEHAELKRDQIHAYGKDDAITACKGSMHSTIEPE
ncbi:MAG: ATP-dependent Clp protease adaptor ClpS [Pirellulales bacterium]|nr:ATP-dependent Clp protease adaptor ClpS [Pirellulales bacterium]MBX3432789.1 ATP-dependent Clp protease adaptor ClpS [Pirellulales bacterium]